MREQVMETIGRCAMLRPGDRVLCALSGGADSVAMTGLLLELSGELGIFVCAAHLNHLLRGAESDEDERFVRRFCEERGIPLFIERADAAAYAKEHRMGLEAGARALRYAFLDRAANALGATRIATAHTADDNLETILFNLSRGAGIDGLCGIPPVRGRIVRPLLYVERREIIRYLSLKNCSYRTDSTNASMDFMRNRIRMVAVPVLRGVNPSVAATVAENTALLWEDRRYLDCEADTLFGAYVHLTEEKAEIEAKILAQWPKAMSGRVIERMYRAVRPEESLAAVHVAAVRRLAADRHPSKSISLPGGVRAAKRDMQLVIACDEEEPVIRPRSLILDGVTELPEISTRIVCRKTGTNEEIHSSFNTFYINCDTIKGNVVVRSRKIGDRLTLRHRGVTKTVKKWMIENRIPADRRSALPVIADENGVIAVFGCGVDQSREAAVAGEHSICITIGSV